MSDGIVRSVLDPHGPVARAIAELSWVLFAGGGAVFVVVVGMAVWAWLAPPERRGWLGRERVVIIGGVVIPAGILGALLAFASSVETPVETATGAAPLRIEVTGHQWWWRVRYLDGDSRPDFDTANELHLPVGRPVELLLASDDVLHSVWIPGLAGKLDMVPGRVNRLRLVADREGVHRGPCAEFCGVQHAKMLLTVVAEPVERFESWREAQRRPATATDPTFAARCAACHSIRGTAANGTLGPDLTHVGGRRMLGAGAIDNNRASLTRWITHSQRLKPGNLMPDIDGLGDPALVALVDYLAGLQ